MIGLYVPGRSPVHRTPALVKLGALAAAVVMITLLREPWQLAVAAAAIVALFLVARIPPRAAAHQIVPVLWLLVVAVPVQAFFGGWTAAVMMGGRVAASVALAALFTLTTQVSAVLDACVTLLAPFRRWVDADRVGLVLALTIRCVPLTADIVREVLEARRARGAQGSIMALAVPVIVRSLQSADELGEALIARGFDD
ncbi:energy-coupling factor transporter transmembrane protein EcfT [Agromyces sp. SYSU K20354]|uniref:energy-coupling factor transporter transmembrane component T family protein n=1 Tax=Agromyces cavernae TaxID=2898659 RepID=UPI001E45A311|nr:energy-coupling factor transporter transmembrane protein EcfT [Agromyces cavernae]MCD2442566.1 energy-coupling factor transporter transmembrane protein EcfT [Agromyces cavernae]